METHLWTTGCRLPWQNACGKMSPFSIWCTYVVEKMIWK